MSAVAELDRLSVTYRTETGPVEAVSEASLSIAFGEVHALVGESGSGKSTIGLVLAGLMAGIEVETEGSAQLLAPSLDLLGSSEQALRKVRGNRVGIVFQDPSSSLNPFHRIGDQIAEALTAHRTTPGRQAGSGALQLLERVGLPEPDRRFREYPHQLSGGMQQRAMIAIAIANSPELLVADEATASLDANARGRIIRLLVDLARERGSSLLLITHDLGLVAQHSDAVTVIRQGRVVEHGKSRHVFNEPGDEYTRELIRAIPRMDAPVRAPTSASHPARAKRGEETSSLLEVSGLSVAYSYRRRLRRQKRSAVEDFSLELAPGEAVGLVGESGCGKSTVCSAITGLVNPDAGSIVYQGTELAGLGGRSGREARAGIQMVFQDPLASLNPRHRVGRIIAEPMRLASERAADRVTELLEQVGLDSTYRSRYPHQLSGGESQRVAIARALGPRPDLLVADEPVSSLDATVQASVLELLLQLQEDSGFALLFVSHDIAVVRQISHRIVVMRAGRPVEEGTAEEICRSPSDPYTRDLLAGSLDYSVPRIT